MAGLFSKLAPALGKAAKVTGAAASKVAEATGNMAKRVIGSDTFKEASNQLVQTGVEAG